MLISKLEIQNFVSAADSARSPPSPLAGFQTEKYIEHSNVKEHV